MNVENKSIKPESVKEGKTYKAKVTDKVTNKVTIEEVTVTEISQKSGIWYVEFYFRGNHLKKKMSNKGKIKVHEPLEPNKEIFLKEEI